MSQNCALATAEFRVKSWPVTIIQAPVASPVMRSEVVVSWLFIHCLLLLPSFVVVLCLVLVLFYSA